MITSGPHLPRDLKKPDTWSAFFDYQVQQELKGFCSIRGTQHLPGSALPAPEGVRYLLMYLKEVL